MPEPSRLVQVDIAPRQALQIARGFLGETKSGFWDSRDQAKFLECGWLFMDGGTIGNPASGATTRAAVDCYDLFCHLWDRTTNTELVIQTSAGAGSTRGASAVADWNANKRLPLPAGAGASPLGVRASGTASKLAAVGGSVDITVKKHYHSSAGDGADFLIDIAHTHPSGTADSAGAHVHAQNVTANPTGSGAGGLQDYDSYGVGQQVYAQGCDTGSAGAHQHTFQTPALALATGRTPTGKFGTVTGGVDGNADQATVAASPFFACQFIIAF